MSQLHQTKSRSMTTTSLKLPKSAKSFSKKIDVKKVIKRERNLQIIIRAQDPNKYNNEFNIQHKNNLDFASNHEKKE